jgi:predicted transcriptional regulator
MSSATFSMRLDVKTKNALEAEARRRDRSAAYIANEAITSFLDKQAYKQSCIEEAVKEADKGFFISEQSMLSWMELLETDPDAPAPQPDIRPEKTP